MDGWIIVGTCCCMACVLGGCIGWSYHLEHALSQAELERKKEEVLADRLMKWNPTTTATTTKDNGQE